MSSKLNINDYELATCEALLKDFIQLDSEGWDIESVYRFWSEYSYYKECDWADYLEGDLVKLSEAIDYLYFINFGNEKETK